MFMPLLLDGVAAGALPELSKIDFAHLLKIGKANVGGRFAHLLKDFFGAAHHEMVSITIPYINWH
jgi:hypothetical protein